MNTTNLPSEIKIFDTVYTIEYVDKPSDVDINKREALWGQIDYWTQSIRIYNNGQSLSSVWQTIWHEILHGICEKLKLKELNKDEDKIDMLAMAINSVIHDN